MRDLAQWALAAAAGADYADVRVVLVRTRTLATKNGRMAAAADAESLGVGIRVLEAGAWGFAATNDLRREAVERAALRARELARAAARVRRRPVVLAPEAVHVASWT